MLQRKLKWTKILSNPTNAQCISLPLQKENNALLIVEKRFLVQDFFSIWFISIYNSRLPQSNMNIVLLRLCFNVSIYFFLLLCLAFINSRLPQSKTSIVLLRLCFNVSICFSSSMFNIYKFTFTAEQYEHCSIKALFQHRRLYVSCFDKLPKQHSRVLTSVNVFSPGNFFISSLLLFC